MRVLFAAAASLAALSTQAQDRGPEAFAHKPSPAHCLKAYALTPAQEADFAGANNGIADFWKAWNNGAKLDETVLSGSEEFLGGGTAPHGDSDCRVCVRAAYGEKGVYLLFEVTDDVWIGKIDQDYYMDDAIDVFTERHSSGHLYSNPSLFKDIDQTQMTESFMQMQVCFSRNGDSPEFRYAYYHPDKTGQNLKSPGEFVLLNSNLTPAEAAQVFGLVVKVHPARAGRPNVRFQEWLVPWDVWGGHSVNSLARRSPGSKLAIAIGYNDKDEADEGQPSYMRWRNRADPYGSGEGPGKKKTSIDSWGDIEIVAQGVAVRSAGR